MTDDRREGSFDELAKGLASGEVSRGRAIRLMGAALVGGALASVPGMAWAAPRPKPNGKRCKTDSQCLSGNCVDRVCQCPSGTTLCGGSCVTDCPSGQTLDPSTCQCLSTCPDQLCCCSCEYTDATGAVVSTCAAPFANDVDACYTYCNTQAPPGTTSVNPNFVCPFYAGEVPVCAPASTGTGTVCGANVPCRPPA